MLAKIYMSGLRSGLILAFIAILLFGCASPTNAPQATLDLILTLPAATHTIVYTSTPLPTTTPQTTQTVKPTPIDTTVPLTATPTPAALIGAGDIVVCGVDHDEQTAAIVEQQLDLFPDATVFIAGDIVNKSGRAVEYRPVAKNDVNKAKGQGTGSQHAPTGTEQRLIAMKKEGTIEEFLRIDRDERVEEKDREPEKWRALDERKRSSGARKPTTRPRKTMQIESRIRIVERNGR